MGCVCVVCGAAGFLFCGFLPDMCVLCVVHGVKLYSFAVFACCECVCVRCCGFTVFTAGFYEK